MTTTAAPATRSPWATFTVCAIASYISTLDMSIVNVAFFEIGKDFEGTPQSTIAWVVTAYSILFGSLLVVSGRLADQIGRRRFFLQGTMLFFVGSLLCAVAPGMGTLIFGRAVQGVGGAMMTPASTGLLLAAFPAEKRGQVMAWTGSIGALGVASGPTLGAFFVSAFGWRSAFWINVPICIITIVLTLRNTTETARGKGAIPDIPSAVVFTAAVGSLVWAISRSETEGWGDTSVLQLFLVAAAFGAVVVRRSRTHDDPLLPAALFRERTFTLANISTMLYGAAFSGNILNNVLFQRTIWEFSANKAGWFSVLSPVTVAVTSMIVGRKMAVIGYRRLLITGPMIMSATVVGSVLFLDVEPTPWFPFLPLMFFLGIGLGSTFPPLSACTVLRLPQERFALGGAINNTFRQVGAAVGVALVVTVQSRTEGIEGFRNGWKVAIVFAVAAAAVSVFQPGRDKQHTA
jgi:EmrB/QacA subfamily drug resistance transporter